MKIGSVELESNIFLAPMAGVTDKSFRKIAKEHGAGLLYTEMVSIKGLLYNDPKTKKLMEINENEKPVALQIFGSDPYIFEKVIENNINGMKEFDIIDINMGCPAPKVTRNGDGSSLMKNPKLIGEIVKSAVKVSEKPVTIKIRKGWDSDNINAIEVGKIIEDSGASGITIHGRTREEYYSGVADWDIIKKLKESVKIPVTGNGDIFVAEDIKKMIDYTKCDAVMIGRGARGNPWIFSRGNNLDIPEPTGREKVELALRHFYLLIENKSERIAINEIRKHTGWYVKGLRNSTELRNTINRMTTKDEVLRVLEEYKNLI